MEIPSIEELKKLKPIERNNYIQYGKFTYIDKSTDDIIEIDLYFTYENGEEEVNLGMQEFKSDTTKEEHLYKLKMELIDTIHYKLYRDIFSKYDYLLENIKKNGSYDLLDGFKELILSKKVPLNELKQLKDFKIFDLSHKIELIKLDCSEISNKLLTDYLTKEEEERFNRYKSKIEKLEFQIEKVRTIFSTTI